MPEETMHEELLLALADSDLREATAAARLLREGCDVEVHRHSSSSDGLLEIYRGRLDHIRALPGTHAGRLAAATSELVSNLARSHAEPGRWVSVKGKEELHFEIFRLERGQILGCLPVVSKLDVSPSRWAELWSKNA